MKRIRIEVCGHPIYAKWLVHGVMHCACKECNHTWRMFSIALSPRA